MNERTELDISVENVTHAVAEITKMDQVIAELAEKYDGVIFDVDTPQGLKGAKEARKEIREPRYLIEKLRKEGKRPILDLGKQLDGKAKTMTERLLSIETPIDDAIKEEEARADRERQAKIEAEQKRVEAIQERIAELRGAVEAVTCMGAPKSEAVAEFISDVEKIAVDDTFEEFQQQAQDAKDATLARLRELHKSAVDREAEEARIKAEREELEKLRAEQAARQAKEDAERKAREAEEAKQRAELEAQRKKQAEEQAKIDAENKRIADERAAFEAEQKAAREREAEAARKKAAEEKAAAEAKAKAEADAKRAKFPGEAAIIGALVKHFGITEKVAKSWLSQCGQQRAA